MPQNPAALFVHQADDHATVRLMKTVARESVHIVSFSVSELVLRRNHGLREEPKRGTTSHWANSCSVHLERNRWGVMLNHLAALYGVQTRALVLAVERNIDRFPQDFQF